MKKVSIRAARRSLMAEERSRSKALAAVRKSAVTRDSFVNFAQKMGVGADNALSTATYGFNPITRIRTMLEWIHRGSWLGGMAVDVVADDMTRAGIRLESSIDSVDSKKIQESFVAQNIWGALNENIKWSRLYGGCVAMMMIDGQDPKTPLRLERVGRGQFKGLYVMDRWMVDPSLNDLVTEMGPDLGTPKYYTVNTDSSAFRGQHVHYSRCLRLVGIALPYWQRVMENLWGISVLERLYDRMIAFDSASTGAAQLVYRAHLRTYKIEDMNEIVANGGEELEGLVRYVEMMRRFQNIEGITLMDKNDDFEGTSTVSFSGLSDAMLQFAQQLSGALGIPLVRLYGQSPAGLSATGESDMRIYYDSIAQQQNKDLKIGVTRVTRAVAQSEGIVLPDGMGIHFNPLWQMTDKEKAEVAEIVARTVTDTEEKGVISQKTAMLELQETSRTTGVFTHITKADVDAAEESLPPAGENALGAVGGEAVGPGGTDKDDGDKESKPKVKDSISSTLAMARLHDLAVIVENAKGTVRRGDGWESVMPADYGFIRGTVGDDSDQVDCFIGPSVASTIVFILRQLDPKTDLEDEDKILLGYDSLTAAQGDYVASFEDGSGWQRIGEIRRTDIAGLKNWLKSKTLPQ